MLPSYTWIFGVDFFFNRWSLVRVPLSLFQSVTMKRATKLIFLKYHLQHDVISWLWLVLTYYFVIWRPWSRHYFPVFWVWLCFALYTFGPSLASPNNFAWGHSNYGSCMVQKNDNGLQRFSQRKGTPILLLFKLLSLIFTSPQRKRSSSATSLTTVFILALLSWHCHENELPALAMQVVTWSCCAADQQCSREFSCFCLGYDYFI